MRVDSAPSRTLFFATWAVSAVVCGSVAAYLARGATVDALDTDEREYYDLAGQLLEGNTDFDGRRTLGHVVILAALRRATGDDLALIKVALSLFFSLSAPLTAMLVLRLSGSVRVALTAGAGVAFWPLFVRYSGTLYSESTALPVFLLFLLALPTRAPVVSVKRCLLAGVLLGVCVLIRPMYQLFGPCAVLVVFLENGFGRDSLKAAALLTVGCLAAILPWSAFISARTGTFILTSASGGETLAGGYNPPLLEQGVQYFYTPSGRRTWSGPGKWVSDSQTGYLSADELRLPLPQRDKLLRQRAIEWITAHPSEAVSLTASKWLLMWGLLPMRETASQVILGNLPIIICLLLAAAALIRFRRHLRELSRFWLLPVFVTLVAVISWGSWRFRQPGDVGLIVLAALLIHHRRVLIYLSADFNKVV